MKKRMPLLIATAALISATFVASAALWNGGTSSIEFPQVKATARTFTFDSNYPGSITSLIFDAETGVSDPIHFEINSTNAGINFKKNYHFFYTGRVGNWAKFSFDIGINNLTAFSITLGIINAGAGNNAYRVDFQHQETVEDYEEGALSSGDDETSFTWNRPTANPVKNIHMYFDFPGSFDNFYIKTMTLTWAC